MFIQYLFYSEHVHTISIPFWTCSFNIYSILNLFIQFYSILNLFIQYLFHSEHAHTISIPFWTCSYNIYSILNMFIQYLFYSEPVHTISILFWTCSYIIYSILNLFIQYLFYSEPVRTLYSILSLFILCHFNYKESIQSCIHFGALNLSYTLPSLSYQGLIYTGVNTHLHLGLVRHVRVKCLAQRHNHRNNVPMTDWP